MSGVWNHPHYVTRVLYFIKFAILKESLPVGFMKIASPWNDYAGKPLLFSLTEGQKKGGTIWMEVELVKGDTPMEEDPLTPPHGLKLNATVVQKMEALWVLMWTSVHCYKHNALDFFKTGLLCSVGLTLQGLV